MLPASGMVLMRAVIQSGNVDKPGMVYDNRRLYILSTKDRVIGNGMYIYTHCSYKQVIAGEPIPPLSMLRMGSSRISSPLFNSAHASVRNSLITGTCDDNPDY